MIKMLATVLIGLAGLAGAAGPPISSSPHRAPLPRPVPRILCAHPPRLELIRFEDGSARLECGRRLLVRVVVPW